MVSPRPRFIRAEKIRGSGVPMATPSDQDEPAVWPRDKAADPIRYLMFCQVNFVLGELLAQKRHQLWDVLGQSRANRHV